MYMWTYIYQTLSQENYNSQLTRMKCVIYKKKKILVNIKLRMWAWVFKNQSGNYLYQGKAAII
jgi:hypothetical protein